MSAAAILALVLVGFGLFRGRAFVLRALGVVAFGLMLLGLALVLLGGVVGGATAPVSFVLTLVVLYVASRVLKSLSRATAAR